MAAGGKLRQNSEEQYYLKEFAFFGGGHVDFMESSVRLDASRAGIMGFDMVETKRIQVPLCSVASVSTPGLALLQPPINPAG
jgi:hypothetical protein